MTDRRPSSNRDWEKWGEIDPLWAVSTSPGKHSGGAAPWTDEEFYAAGQAAWEKYLVRWRRYGLDPASCVEIGCGAGRLTKHMAATFLRIAALDVSPAMLAYAKKHVPDPRVTFLLAAGDTIPLADASVSAAFSTYVFQHFDTLAHATAYFGEIARVLRPGGTMLIQQPVHAWPWDRGVFEWLHRVVSVGDDARVWVRRKLVPLGVRPPMRGLSYGQQYVFETLHAVGLEDVEVASHLAPGQRSSQQLVLARKPLAAR